MPNYEWQRKNRGDIEMIFQNFTQTYPKTMAKTRVHQQVRTPKAIEFPGGLLLWKSLGKVSFVILLAVLSISMVTASFAAKNTQAIQAITAEKLVLMNSGSILAEKQKQLLSREQIQILAGEKLSLIAPGKGKLYQFNR